MEPGRELGDVEEDALRGSDSTESGTRGPANAVVQADGVLERAMLLGVVAIRAEGGVSRASRAVSVDGEVLRELSGGRGGVRSGGVVDVGRNGARTNEPDEGGSLSMDSSLSKDSRSSEHCEGFGGGR